MQYLNPFQLSTLHIIVVTSIFMYHTSIAWRTLYIFLHSCPYFYNFFFLRADFLLLFLSLNVLISNVSKVFLIKVKQIVTLEYKLQKKKISVWKSHSDNNQWTVDDKENKEYHLQWYILYIFRITPTASGAIQGLFYFVFCWICCFLLNAATSFLVRSVYSLRHLVLKYAGFACSSVLDLIFYSIL